MAIFLITLFGVLVVLYNSENVLYSDRFLNSSANIDVVSLIAAIITPANAIILVTFFILAMLAGSYLSSGIYGVCLEGARGRTTVKTFYGTVLRRGGTYLLASLTLFVLGSLLLIALVFPIVVFSNLFLPSFAAMGAIYYISLMVVMLLVSPLLIFVPISVVWGRGIGDAFKQSFSIGRENYYEMLALIAMMAAMVISLEFIPYIGVLLQIFAVIPVFMFTICSYYLDKASVRKGFENRARADEESLPVETVIPKTRKIRVVKARIMDTSTEAPKESAAALPEKKQGGAKPKVVIITPGKEKGRKRKASIYVVARKRPVRIKLASQKKNSSKAKLKASSRKTPVRKAKKGRKLS
jgi:hypothetical protein